MSQINIRLGDKEVAILDALGGKKKGIQFLIEEFVKKEKGKERVKTIEENFMDRIITPGEQHLKDLYISFLIIHLQRGGGMGSLDYFEHSLCAATGFNSKTVRSMFRKLNQSNFIKNKNFLFRPTIRLIDEEAKKGFQEIFEDYVLFIQNAEHYTDWLEKETENL